MIENKEEGEKIEKMIEGIKNKDIEIRKKETRKDREDDRIKIEKCAVQTFEPIACSLTPVIFF